MRNDLPISPKKKFKYSITFQSFDEESLEAGQSDVRGYEVEDDTDLIGDILYKANTTYGIYMPVSFGTWESTEPNEDRDFWEKGIRKYHALHLTNEDGTEISQEESDFISFLLSDGHYEIDKFRDYAVGGIVLGSIALGVGALITYFYFKGKKGKKGKKSLGNNRAKSVTHTINGKERTFPIKDAWRKDHNVENKSQKFEVPQADRYEMGGDASQHYHEIEYGEGGVARAKDIITKKIGFNEVIADYLIGKSEKFAIWLADSILKQEIAEREENKSVVLESLNQRSYSVNTNFINNNYGGGIREVLDWLQHPVTPKQDLKQLSFEQALEKAREWHNELQVLGGDIDFTEPKKNTILKKYPVNSDGIEYYWVFIPSNYCDLESSRMGHCGRTGYGNNLISLRSVKAYGKGHTINDSHITIAYGINDGIFYQVKGKKNNKPAEKYFPYIFDLIKSAIKDNDIEYSKNSNQFDENNTLTRSKSLLEFNGFGSEYGADEDYGFEDMSKAEIREMYDLKPTLFESAEDNYMLLDAGVITLDEFKEIVEREPDTFSSFGNQMKLYDRGIITEQPNTSFELKYDCDDVYRLLDIDRDFSDDLVENILCGDIGELSDSWSYYYDNPSDLVNNLNKKNEQRVIDEIVRITKYDESVVKENGIEYYLKGEDENFPSDDFDNIIRALASAQSSADNGDYYKYLYDAVESALNELGDVHSLNDEGVKMTIELSNSMSLEEIAYEMDDYNFSDIADLFNEKIGEQVDKPSLRIDDRYSPYGSSEDFNEYISDIDLEQGYKKGGSLRPKSTTSKKTKIKSMKPSQRKLAQGGNIGTTGISKEDYFLVVKNWVYFTFNYPMGFVKDAFDSKHLEEKFSSSYERYGSIGVLMSFWANLDGDNRRILALWIKNNYFNSSSEKTKLQSISDKNYAQIITHWNMFCFNFPYGFIENVYGDNTSHFEMKWVRAYESAGSTGAVNKFFTEMSSNNQELLTDWVYDNYKGMTFAGGGSVDKKGKIELSDGAEGRKIAKRIIVEKDDAGDLVTYDLEVGLFEGRKKGYFIVEGTWDEVMEAGTEDEYTEERYFYQEGGLSIEGGKVYDYDGVFELEPKLKPLMSALNLNSSEVFADGGEAGGWKIGDKFKVLKGIYGDYNSPYYANREFEVINIRDGKYIDARNKRGNTETFNSKNIEKISFANGGDVVKKPTQSELDNMTAFNLMDAMKNDKKNYELYKKQLLKLYPDAKGFADGGQAQIKNEKNMKYANGGNAGDWSVTDTTNAEYLGVIEFQDNEGEFHNFEIMETDDRLVFGGMTNSGFIESGYIEKDGFSTDETLQSLLEDLEVYYNDGAEYTSQIVFNQRMAQGGDVYDNSPILAVRNYDADYFVNESGDLDDNGTIKRYAIEIQSVPSGDVIEYTSAYSEKEASEMIKKINATQKVYADGGEINLLSDKFTEAGYDTYARNFGVAQIGGFNDEKDINILVSANLLDMYDATGEEEFEDKPFVLILETHAYPEFWSDEYAENIKDMVGDDTINPRTIDYLSDAHSYGLGVPLSTYADDMRFNTEEEAIKFLNSKKLNDQISGLGFLSGFHFDKQINRIGDTGWKYLSEQVGANYEEYAKGGVAGKKYILLGYSATASKDSYDEGELESVGDWDDNLSKEFSNKKDLIDYINNNIIYVDYKESDFDWETGEGKNIQTDVLCTYDDYNGYYPADEKAKQLWKKGKKELFNVHYWINVQAVIPTTYKKGGEISVWNLRKGDKIKTRKGDIETIERKIESGYFTKESEYSHPFESIEFIERPNSRMAEGGRVTTNDGIIEAFLTSERELKVGNLSTHFNQYDKQMLLRNYGTLIATRKGNNVEITNVKYSRTTTIITNKVDSMANQKGMNVSYVSKFAEGGETGETTRDNYDALIGRMDNEFYFLDDIFKYKDGFKGATGTIVMPVNSQYYEYATSEDGILERFMDAMGEDEWLEALQLNRDDFEDEDDLTKAIEDGIYQLYSYGELQPFEDAGSDIESQMRELSEFADESKYPLFEVIGGGRIFGKDVVFDEIYNQELYDKIKQIEEFAKGGKVKRIKKRVSSIKKRAEKLLEESITYIWKSTDMGSGWYFMLENPNGGVLDTSLVLDIFDGDEYVSEYDDVEDWNSLSKADKKYYFDQYKEELLQVNYDYFKDEMVLNYLDEFIEYLQRDSDDNFAEGGEAGENLENYSDYDEFYNVVFEYIKREENLTEEETKDICITNESIIEAEFDGGSSPRFTGDVVLGYLSNERAYKNYAEGGESDDNYGGQRNKIVTELKGMKGGLDNKAPYVFIKEGFIYVSAENGDNYADYDEYTIDEQLEDLADRYNTYWDWETAGSIILAPIDTYAEGGEASEFNYRSNFLYVTEVPNGLKLELTDEGINGYKEEEINDMYDLFEDIQANSEMAYIDNAGDMGFGLTEAPIITDGYYYDDMGEFTDEGVEDSKVYVWNDYMLKDLFATLMEQGSVVLTEVKSYADGGSTDDDDDSGAIQEQLDELVQDFNSDEYKAFCYEHDIEEEDAQEMSDFIYSQTNNRCKEIIQEIEDGYYAGGYDDMEVDDYAEGGRITKYVAVYMVQGNYGQGWEDLTAHDTFKEAKAERIDYDKNERNYPHRVITRRVLRSDYEKGNYAEGGESDDNYGGQRDEIVAELKSMKGGLDNKAPYVFIKDGLIYVSAENGDNYADYYELLYIDEQLEELANKYDTYWDWEDAGSIVLFPIDTYAEGGEADKKRYDEVIDKKILDREKELFDKFQANKRIIYSSKTELETKKRLEKENIKLDKELEKIDLQIIDAYSNDDRINKGWMPPYAFTRHKNRLYSRIPQSIENKIIKIYKKYKFFLSEKDGKKALKSKNQRGYGAGTIGIFVFGIKDSDDAELVGGTALELGEYYNKVKKENKEFFSNYRKNYSYGGEAGGVEQNFEVGDIVELSESGWDNESYHDFFKGVDNIKLVITDVYTNESEHQGFDTGVEMALYSTKTLENDEEVPFDLYDYELEYVGLDLDGAKIIVKEIDADGNFSVEYDEENDEWYWEENYSNGYNNYRGGFSSELQAYNNLIDYLQENNYAEGGRLQTSKLVVEETGEEVELPYKTKDFRGDDMVVIGFTEPRSSASEGRIEVEGRLAEYYPSVAGLKIISILPTFSVQNPNDFAEGGFVVNNNTDLQEVAKYMTNAVKKHRWDLKDLIHYFEKDNNFDYKKRVKIWEDMNGYEMKKTYDNIYEMLKRISEANGSKFADGGVIKLKIKNVDSFDKHYDEVGFTKKQMSLPKQDSNKNWFTTTKDKSIAEQLISDGFVEKYASGGEINWNGEDFDYWYSVATEDSNESKKELNKLSKKDSVNYDDVTELALSVRDDINDIGDFYDYDEDEWVDNDAMQMCYAIAEKMLEQAGVKVKYAGGGSVKKDKLQQARDYWKELEGQMSAKQKKFYNELLKRRQPSFEKNFNDSEIAEYINGEIIEQFGVDLGITKYQITGVNAFKLGFKYIAYREAIEEPEFWEEMNEYAGGGVIAKPISFTEENEGLYYVEFSDGENVLVDFTLPELADQRTKKYIFQQAIHNYKRQLDEEGFAEGGEVEDWMEQALDSLMEETGSTDLEISYVSDIGNSFYATDNNLEYRVFKSEDDAEEVAVEQVREDLEENAEYFNQDWLMNYIDGRDFFEEALTEMNDGYVQDIESETYKTKYANRLIDELVENGLMDEDDAESDNAEELADDLKYDYVALLTQEKLEEGNDGLDYFINNFGEKETYKMVMDNNLIDIDEASRDAVQSDGIAHFLSSYDGETLYLSDDCVAYRTN